MVEIRIKSNDVKEINDFMSFFEMSCIPGYHSFRMSKAYVLRNGDYKFFLECISQKDFKTYKDLPSFKFLNNEKPLKKRGRKPKGLKLLEQ